MAFDYDSLGSSSLVMTLVLRADVFFFFYLDLFVGVVVVRH